MQLKRRIDSAFASSAVRMGSGAAHAFGVLGRDDIRATLR
jgi:hypothetical protein